VFDLKIDESVAFPEPGKAHSHDRWKRLHIGLTSCPYLVRLDCFENVEN